MDVDPGRKRLVLRSNGGSDAFVVRYDKAGRPEWAFGVGGTGNDSANAPSAITTANVAGIIHGRG